MSKFRIQDVCGGVAYYLAEGSKHRGSQAGYGRIVTTDPNQALLFDSHGAARVELERSYDAYERDSLSIEEIAS